MLDHGIIVKKKSTVQHLYDYGTVCSYDEHVLQHKQVKKNQMVFHVTPQLVLYTSCF